MTQLVRKLTDWFARHKREMPWRRTRDPYCIWISEIMLQQTQVATVIPYYERFIARFPDVRTLATADLDEVLKLWAGLGYYSRARNLHRGAKHIVEHFGGQIPRESEAIMQIPGIGRYTAGAILSIAFDLPEPIVDGNVARVISRVERVAASWKDTEGKKELWQHAEALVKAAHRAKISTGDFNQALMELGATICAPANPVCLLCPISKHCAARESGQQHLFPVPVEKTKQPVVRLEALVYENSSGEILFAQREPNGLFGGLWELPMTEAAKPAAAKKLVSVKHVLTHRVLKIDVLRATSAVPPNAFPCWSGSYAKFAWYSPQDAATGKHIALPSVQQQILKKLTTQIPSPLGGGYPPAHRAGRVHRASAARPG